MYGQYGERPGGMAERLFAAYSPVVRGVGRLLAPRLEAGLRKMYRIDAEGIADARTRIEEAFDKLERETEGDPGRYLAGDRLTIADIAAASMLAPVVAPPESPWAPRAGDKAPPSSVLELRAQLAQRPGSAWVNARYARDRHPA